ncbi:N-acetyl-gamma-glutamyl-phosphate reductase [Aureimonas frigidaquae]|uniref:N-acetyl-gamma-glutamyl-phosphate reductase n=1 Tax=Aureimonas frigidaquae TaxID=424757 RepID=A0A0P0Z225_9HYPH|nr:N-acetyl-gamma-glutamyl-phosphate reductase [Aureimonas frigidaquae]BAT28108.1 N-acetyl-gamma-glutamyl-phosphate reductase [Aureimonas frigidaquae]
MSPRIFIDGEHGTTGLQIRARLSERRDITLLSIPEAERRNPALREDMLNAADIAILCLPDDASREVVALLAGNDTTRLIDTSTAHRTAPGWVYGFAELERDQAAAITAARHVANPGCYPTGAIALLRPLRDAGLLPGDYPVSVNAVSGYSGGGKQMIAQMEDASRPDAISAPHFLYGLDLTHKHLPEMRTYGRLPRDPIFAPSVGRFPQGMLVQVPLHLDGVSAETVHAALAEHYDGQDIVTVAPMHESAALKRIDPTELAGTDRMVLHVFASPDGARLNLVALLDNLGKGASGAAVQNMDLMLQR